MTPRMCAPGSQASPECASDAVTPRYGNEIIPDAAASRSAAPTESVADLHTPVLLERCLDLLAVGIEEAPAPVMIDCTLGMGGHTEGALRRFPQLTVVGIDRDTEAIELASRRLAPFGERFHAVHATYDHVAEVAARFSPYGDGTVDAILADLGVSSLQLDDADRGFSYARPAPLDMRMDQSTGPTAADILATADAAELTYILRTYGEERFAPGIAKAIVRRREDGQPLTTTAELADLVRECIPAAARRTGGNPAKRTFQALRIAVNAELDVLQRTIPRALNSLRVGGCLVVESYQSLEDRIVKQAFTAGSTVNVPQGLPFIPEEAAPYLRLITHGAEQADDSELASNPRSAPVRLRAAQRIRPASQAPAPEKEGYGTRRAAASKHHTTRPRGSKPKRGGKPRTGRTAR